MFMMKRSLQLLASEFAEAHHEVIGAALSSQLFIRGGLELLR